MNKNEIRENRHKTVKKIPDTDRLTGHKRLQFKNKKRSNSSQCLKNIPNHTHNPQFPFKLQTVF